MNKSNTKVINLAEYKKKKIDTTLDRKELLELIKKVINTNWKRSNSSFFF